MVMDQQTYVLQLMADGEVDRALMQVRGYNDDFSVLVRQILDRWDDVIEEAVADAEENFEPDWGDCPNCSDHEHEAETLQMELDDLTEEVGYLRSVVKKGHCPSCLPPDSGVEHVGCPGGLREG